MHVAANKVCTIIAIWIAVVLSAAAAGAANLIIDPQNQLNYARQLYEEQQYRRAAEEFERFAFFFPNDPRQPEAMLRSGESFLLANEFDQALRILQALTAGRSLDETTVDANFAMAETYLKMNRTPQALNQLRNLIKAVEDNRVKDRAWFRIGWIQLNQHEWPAAQEAFEHISAAGRRTYRLDILESGLAQADAIPQKSPALAGALSILPGAGQAYNGRYEDALIAFLLNAGLIWAALDAFDDEQYALGGLLSFVGIGFYSANIYGAISGAHDYNETRNQEFVNHLQQQVNIGLIPSDRQQPTGKGLLLLSFQIRF